MTAFLDPASMGAGGTQLIVNGMEVNNVGVTPSAIQEVRINQNPYSAEFARPGRGRLEIITRATASEYHGTFNFIFVIRSGMHATPSLWCGRPSNAG